MEVGDLVKVNKQCDAGGLWHKVGIVVGWKRRYCSVHGGERRVQVCVLLDERERLFDYCALEVINASR